MKIVDERENRSTWNCQDTTVQGAEYKHWEQLATFFALMRPGRHPDIWRIHRCLSAGFSASWTPLLGSRRSAALYEGMDTALRSFTGCVHSKGTGEEETVCVTLCFVIWSSERLCKVPMSYSNSECSRHQHQTELLQFLLYILYLLGQFTKRAIWRII